MNIILLNWKNGENDPFSFFNDQLQKTLIDFGCDVDIIELNESFAENLKRIQLSKRIDIAITHQGLGSSYQLPSSQNSIWQDLKIKLICLHGDHPCHAPHNHNNDSKYIIHTYGVPEFCTYSNKFFQRQHPALYLPQPQYFKFNEFPLEKGGDFFVLPKNFDDPESTFLNWTKTFPKFIADFLIGTSEEIKINFNHGDLCDHHEIINNNLTPELFQKIFDLSKYSHEIDLFHYLHALLDKSYRNSVTDFVMNELQEFPLKVNGRGWDRFIKKQNKNHEFNNFTSLKSGNEQFSSNFGIVDVTSHRNMLHDRTMRAISLNGSFMSNSKILFQDCKGLCFNEIFYSGHKDDLSNKAQAIVDNPNYHWERCKELSKEISNAYKFENFHKFLYAQVQNNF